MSRCIKRSSSRRISGTIRREREREREREQQQQHHQNGFPFCFVGVPPPVFPARQAYRSFGRSSRSIFLCPLTHCFKSRICLFFDGRESLTSSGKPDVTPRRDFRVSCQFLNIPLDSEIHPPFRIHFSSVIDVIHVWRNLSSYTQKRIIRNV